MLPWNIFEKAIAGKQKKAVEILRKYGFELSPMFGACLMRLSHTFKQPNRMQFLIDWGRVQLVIHAGLDLRSIRITPWHALWHSCMTHRSTYKARIFARVLGFEKSWRLKSGKKWCHDQTLLEVAINCAQKELVEHLIDLKIEAANLTSDQLHTCFL